MAIGYEAAEWKDLESGGTPIEAADLNRIEGGIVALDQAIDGKADQGSVNEALAGKQDSGNYVTFNSASGQCTDALVSANVGSGQPIFLTTVTDLGRNSLIASSTNGYLGLWHNDDSSWHWKTPMMSATEYSEGSAGEHSNYWMWRKWADGYVELWGNRYVANYQMDDKDASGTFFYGPTITVSLPFNVWWATPSVTVYHDPGLYGWNLKAITINKFTMVAWGNATRVMNLDFKVHVVGFWKNLGDWE